MRESVGVPARFYLSLSAMWLMMLAVLPFTKVQIVYGDFTDVIGLGLILAGLSLGAGRLKWIAVRNTLGLFAGFFLIFLPLIVVNYVAMSFEMPLMDDVLSQWDRSIGFDWHSFIAYVDGIPWLARAFDQAYGSFLIQVVLVPLLLQVTGQSRRAFAFVTSYGLVCFLAAFIAVYFPAYGTYSYYGFSEGELANIDMYFGYQFIEQFEAVRSQETYLVTASTLAGILTFPSVHAAVAYLAIWATWSNRWLRVPFLLLNVTMALSAVVNANHYLVDILVSIPLAAITVWIVKRIYAMEGFGASLSTGSEHVPGGQAAAIRQRPTPDRQPAEA
ncbi:phosphatase PAP2 family protein [uncultured Hoeflea sp.]|uniref:phosphatase PAP2 family protein n=1 Tax=uncultured Hoeflea sp. TaxID=538666 RepID=UPI00260464B1|nr:phosphatase PAP2 family protein [uncultured Hoeflea sp.]